MYDQLKNLASSNFLWKLFRNTLFTSVYARLIPANYFLHSSLSKNSESFWVQCQDPSSGTKKGNNEFLNDFQWRGLINPTYSQIGATGSHSDRTAVHHRANEGGIAVVARRFQWTHHRTHRSFQPIRSLAETKRSVNGHASLRSQSEFKKSINNKAIVTIFLDFSVMNKPGGSS